MTIREHIADILNVPLYECLDWTTWKELGNTNWKNGCIFASRMKSMLRWVMLFGKPKP